MSRIYTFAWLFGFFISMLVYYVINTWISSQHDSLIAEAVYPPGKFGESSTPPTIEGIGEDYENKEGVVATEKEMV
jgi:NCS1 family nucleobase:cation symporter-1